MKGQRIGYIRVSTSDQNPDRQLDGVETDKRFIDRASGKNTNRPQLEAMLTYVREGDVLLVHSLDRLARNLDDLRHLVNQLTRRGVSVTFIKESLTFTGSDSPMAQLLLSVMGAFAEFERAHNRERQREGITIAKNKGAYQGRKRVMTPEQVKEARSRVQAGEHKTEIARSHGIHRATLYQYLQDGLKQELLP